MSILPSHTHQGSASSTSSSPSNPNSDYGFLHQQQQHLQLLSLSSDSPISTGDMSSESNVSAVSGSVAEETADCIGSSKKVNGYGRSNGKKRSPHQSGSSGAQWHPVAQEGSGPPHSKGEMSGSPPNHRSSGRRSQTVNGNHLLNFYYNPISHPERRPPPRKPRKIKPYNKDLFLQANYKFVVLDTGEYSIESMDPDKMLQWEDIICFMYSTPNPVQCPICLESPLCPQVTSCGHIFCFPCILRYLFMGEENHKGERWKKCPLCFMTISSKELYTIYLENVKQYHDGDTLEFTLLTRKKDSFSLHQKLEGGRNIRPCETFSKFILTSDVELSVREAISSLDSWLVRAESGLVDDPERLPYVCDAMEELKHRKKYWDQHRKSEGNKASKHIMTSDGLNSNYENHELGHVTLPDESNKTLVSTILDVPVEGACVFQSSDTDESQEGQERVLSSSYEDKKTLHVQSSGSRDTKDKDSYSFYQAIDGQHIILHPLNMRCLVNHYGSYDLLPSRISGKILQLETVTQSEAMRKRYRYLSHFPLTTTFQFCEIDLSEVLPLDALSPFMDEIKKREKQRKLLAEKEQEAKIKAEAAAACSTLIPYNVLSSSYDNPPTFSLDDFEALGSTSSAAATAASSPPINGGRRLFSNVARLGFAAAHDSPSLPTQNAERTNGSTALSGSRNQGLQSFANVISREKPEETPDTLKVNETGRKGKKPSRVLMSTSGGRRY